jgi:hypothetical protein
MQVHGCLKPEIGLVVERHRLVPGFGQPMRDNSTEGIFHIHSNYSYDGKISLAELKYECTKRNLRFILLTEHAQGFDKTKLQKLVEECKHLSTEGFFAVPGLEFSLDEHKDTHILAVGLQTFPADSSLNSIIEETKKNGGLLVIAHPTRNSYFLPENIIDTMDGIEIWNAAYNSRYLPDAGAISLLKELKTKNSDLVGLGGLDLHDNSGFKGLRLAVLAGYHSQEGLLKLIRDGDFENRGQYLTVSSKPDLGSLFLLLLSFLRVCLKMADSTRWKITALKKLVKVKLQQAAH